MHYMRLSRSLSLFEKSKAAASRVSHTRAYSTSNTGALRIHSDELNNSTDRLTESETLMGLVDKYICATLIHRL